jgi:ubiquinone/menaquinone biosynthesis C-methylase UbiE
VTRSPVPPVERRPHDESTPGTYGRFARWYDLLARSERRPAALGVELLSPQDGERLLEIGCGPGRTLVELAARVAPAGHVDAVDLSPEMVRLARRRLGQAGLGGVARAYEGDARRLPFADGSFDGVLMSFTLELFDAVDRRVVLAEARRVLRPAGRLVVVSLTSAGRSTAARRIYVRLHERYPRQIDCTPIDVTAELRRAGFATDPALRLSMWGLPAEIVRAEPREADPTT